jgi:hypothetical protein
MWLVTSPLRESFEIDVATLHPKSSILLFELEDITNFRRPPFRFDLLRHEALLRRPFAPLQFDGPSRPRSLARDVPRVPLSIASSPYVALLPDPAFATIHGWFYVGTGHSSSPRHSVNQCRRLRCKVPAMFRVRSQPQQSQPVGWLQLRDTHQLHARLLCNPTMQQQPRDSKPGRFLNSIRRSRSEPFLECRILSLEFLSLFKTAKRNTEPEEVQICANVLARKIGLPCAPRVNQLESATNDSEDPPSNFSRRP